MDRNLRAPRRHSRSAGGHVTGSEVEDLADKYPRYAKLTLPGSVPPACEGRRKTGGAHSPFLYLLVVARMSLGGIGGWAGHTLAKR